MLNSRCNFHARQKSISGTSSGEDGTMKSSKSARSIATWTAAALGMVFSGLALALEWNLQPAGSKLAEDIHDRALITDVLCR
jgi:hypothetical protein